MSKLPKLTWLKQIDMHTLDQNYSTQIKGKDTQNNQYYYTAFIEKVNVYLKDGSIKSGYKATYKTFINANLYVSLSASKEPFKTLAEAKTWVKNGLALAWKTTNSIEV